MFHQSCGLYCLVSFFVVMFSIPSHSLQLYNNNLNTFVEVPYVIQVVEGNDQLGWMASAGVMSLSTEQNQLLWQLLGDSRTYSLSRTVTIPSDKLTKYTHLRLGIRYENVAGNVSFQCFNSDGSVLVEKQDLPLVEDSDMTLIDLGDLVSIKNHLTDKMMMELTIEPTFNSNGAVRIDHIAFVQLTAGVGMASLSTSSVDAVNDPTNNGDTIQISNAQISNDGGGEPDTTSANISNVMLDEKEVRTGDFISNNPNISASFLDAESGIATWNIELISLDTDAVVESINGNGLLSTSLVNLDETFLNLIDDGRYYIRFIVFNGAGLIQTYRTDDIVVKSSFSIDRVLAAPNPFNPNNETLHIEYQLSHDAKVTIYVYNIAGERQWERQIESGYPNGGSAGYNSVEWDGWNRFGEKVANGVYIAYVVAEGQGDTDKGKVKVMVLK